MNSAFNKAAFSEWLVAKGGSVLSATNEWEVLRYRTLSNETGVVYQNKKGALSFTPQSRSDLDCFLKETNFAPTEKVSRIKNDWSAKMRGRLLKRDGPCCVFCGQFLDRGVLKPTIEHFHALSKTGNNHEHNLALACEGCNATVGDEPIVEKIKFRDAVRQAIASVAPWEVVDTRRALLKEADASAPRKTERV